jgi:hypothetical protein
LAKTAAGTDEELLYAVQALLKAIERQAPEVAQAIGVDMEDIKAAALTIRSIRAGGQPPGFALGTST